MGHPVRRPMKRAREAGMGIEKEAPNVVTTKYFHDLIRSGYLAEVVCTETAYKKAAFWYGEWQIRVVNEDRTFEMYLSTATREAAPVKIRTAKTINGLVSILHEAGFRQVCIPLEEGGRQILSLSENSATSPNKD